MADALANTNPDGTIIGDAADMPIAFHGSTAVVQYSGSSVTTTGFTAGSSVAVQSVSTFTGGTGSTAYTISDIVKALKQKGLIAS